jgi:3-methylcrotonyl-CoA carboxylase beta subunit
MPAIQSSVSPSSDAFKANAERMKALVEDLKEKAALVEKGGTDEARARHTARGKLLPRERLAQLIDPGSPFLEIGQFAAWGMYSGDIASAGMIAGVARVEGREVMVVVNDATVKGGTYYPMTVKKHLRAQEIAAQNNLPCIYLVDSGGANLPNQDEVFPDREHFGRIFFNQANMSAAGIPQIACVMGSCTAGGAYVPAMSDESIMVRKQATIFLGGPPLVKAATGEEVSAEDLGGAEVHTRESGVADHYAMNDEHALAITRRIVRNLNRKKTIGLDLKKVIPPLHAADELYGIVPTDLRQPYDVREVIARIVDGSEFDEFKTNLRHNARHRLCASLWHAGWHHRQQRRAVFRERAEGRAFHRTVLPAQDPAAVPAEHHRLHGRQRIRSRRHRQGRRKSWSCALPPRVPKVTLIIGGSFGAGNYGMCGRAYGRAFCGCGRMRASPSWAGEQAAMVLAQVRREGIERKGGKWSAAEEAEFKKPTLEKYEREGHPLYSSARLWDDGIIDPAKSRDVLGLSLSAALNAEVAETKFGVFRM